MKACLVSLLLLLGMFGCNRQEAGVPLAEQTGTAHGDTIIEASIGEPSTLLPVLASDSASSDINGLVYDGLLRYDKNLQLEGVMAEAWEISPDNLTITFRLRKGIKWHDGAPFTSADVLFTYQMYIDPQVPTSYAEDFKQVAHAEAPDPYTFRVTYRQPYAPALESWGAAIHPKHLLTARMSPKAP